MENNYCIVLYCNDNDDDDDGDNDTVLFNLVPKNSKFFFKLRN